MDQVAEEVTKLLLSYFNFLCLGYGGRLCGEDIDGCNDVDCFPGVECTDNPAPLTGATCGDCPNGTLARNDSCEG